MDFNLKDARPIWQQLAEEMTTSIVTGEFPPGSRFPSVRDLAVQAGVNPNTMQRSLARLEETGLLITERTAGRSVTTDEAAIQAMRQQLAESKLKEYLEEMKKLGFSAEEAALLTVSYGKETT